MTANVVTPKLLEEALAASDARQNSKFGGLETKFGGLETKFGGLETKFGGLETRFGALETKVDGLETKVDGLETRFDGLETRFDGLETKFDALREDLHTELRHHFTALNLAMAQLRIDIQSDTLHSIQSVEESYRTRIAAVDDKVRELPERVAVLEQAVGIKRS